MRITVMVTREEPREWDELTQNEIQHETHLERVEKRSTTMNLKICWSFSAKTSSNEKNNFYTLRLGVYTLAFFRSNLTGRTTFTLFLKVYKFIFSSLEV